MSTDLIAGPPPAEHAGPRTVQIEWATVAWASVWLVFLAFPMVGVARGDLPAASKVMTLGGLVAFAAVYVLSWVFERPPRGRSNAQWLGMWLTLLVLCAAVTVPALGGASLMLLPFLMAQITFRVSGRKAVIVVALIAAGGVLAAVAWAPAEMFWLVPMLVVTTLLFLLLRAVEIAGDRERAREREVALLRQREEFARDVHDLLGHSLTVVAVKTELARKLVDRDPARAAAELDDVLALSREALVQVRSTVGQLRSPEWMSQLGSARTALEAAGIEPVLPARPDLVPAEQQATFAWCLREAVTNVVRHSGATRCVITAEPGVLVIMDDGVGVNSPAGDAQGVADGTSHHFGSGVAGMRARVEERGGTLSIGPACESGSRAPGTRVEVTLP